MTLFFELFDHFPEVKMGHFEQILARLEGRSHLERAGKANRKQQRIYRPLSSPPPTAVGGGRARMATDGHLTSGLRNVVYGMIPFLVGTTMVFESNPQF